MTLDGQEAQNRARAMLAYARLKLEDLGPLLEARGIQVSDTGLQRLAGPRAPAKKPPSSEHLVAIAEATRVPVEFFYADLSRLGEIVPTGTIVPARVKPPALDPLPREASWPDGQGA